jgi:hypothetical protein
MIMLQQDKWRGVNPLSHVGDLQLAQSYLVDTKNRTGAKSVHNEYMRGRDLSLR